MEMIVRANNAKKQIEAHFITDDPILGNDLVVAMFLVQKLLDQGDEMNVITKVLGVGMLNTGQNDRAVGGGR